MNRHEQGFLNPYNFVSIPDRDALPPDLRDDPPAGHDHYDPERWTGSIPLTVTTRTPLLVPDHAQAAAKGDGGEAPPPLPVRVDHEGRPLLSLSAVKGMLRSAYEAITNSRFGVFTGHDTRLATRGEADTRKLRPGVVTARDEKAKTATISWAKSLTPLLGVGIPEHMEAGTIRPLAAVWVPRGLTGGYRDCATVEAWLYLARHNHGFWVWRAMDLGPPGKISSTPPKHPRGKAHGRLLVSDHPLIRVRGRLHCTGSSFPAGDYKKHDERLIVEQVLTSNDARLATRSQTIDERLIAGWELVIDSFSQAHEGDPDRHKKYGTYVHKPAEWRPLPKGRTLHVELDNAGKITALYPAMIGRMPFPGAPKVSLPASHHPATSRKELSPADRVFGWVRDGAEKTGVAHRGHLRVEAGDRPPEATAVKSLPFTLPLATLNSPKPSQFLFYLADGDGAPLSGKRKMPTEGYPDAPGDRRLRGRKVYLTHRDVLDDKTPEYWTIPRDVAAARRPVGNPPRHREYVEPDKTVAQDKTKEKVTTTITQWVEPKTEFTVLLRVDNLSRTELAALLWLLDLPDGAALQLGLGKPLGFGAVRVSTDWDNVRLFTGDAVCARYRSLSSVPKPEPGARDLVAEYDTVLREHLPQVRAEFLAAATGFPGLPVHYPRAHPKPEAESYKWWVANDEKPIKHQPAPRLALPLLLNKEGHPAAPLLPYQAPKRDQS